MITTQHRKLSAPRSLPRAFTLIELLVVVAIIALLISILLPSLSHARRVAKTVKCAAQLKGIGLAMATYAAEYDNAILGNAHTSGAFLDPTRPPHIPPYGDTNCPNVSQCWDWMAPVARQMGLIFDEGGNIGNRLLRFKQMATHPAFLCPENDILSTSYIGSPINVPTTAMVSYNTASIFQYEYGTPEPKPYGHINYVDFQGYRTKVSLVGNPSSKIFIADGARFSMGTTAPDVYLDYLSSGSSPGGHYADFGPWSSHSRAYMLPNGPSFAMRHGNRTPNLGLASYRFNTGFFDGHVDTVDGLRGADPGQWSPTGTIIQSSEFTTEAAAAYCPGTQFVSP